MFNADIDDLFSILEALVDVNDEWFPLGLALGLRPPTLESITSFHKREMLTKWLKQIDGCRPSWEALVEALEKPTVQCHLVANKIKRTHNINV